MASPPNETMGSLAKAVRLGEVFTPASPIDSLRLFTGRKSQRRDIFDAIVQRGRHAVLYGERGVGKTSLASVLHEELESIGKSVVAPRVNCDDSDDFSTLWRKVFRQFRYQEEKRLAGFAAETVTTLRSISDELEKRDITPDDVRHVLATVGKDRILIVIIDEYDRIVGKVGALFADTIKTLSDHSVPATLILVGVAETVDSLILRHESVERAIAQVRVPRMSNAELDEIVTRGLTEVEMQIRPGAKRRIVVLSQGLPHYTHLIALYAARTALEAKRDVVELPDVMEGVRHGVRNAQEHISALYHRAVMSRESELLYRQVALAAALAPVDERGCFGIADVHEPMAVVADREIEGEILNRQLHEFCSVDRGPLLTKVGSEKNFRLQFINPFLPPYIIMDGFDKGLMDEKRLDRLRIGASHQA